MKTEEVTAETNRSADVGNSAPAREKSPFWKRRAVVTTSVVAAMLVGSISLAPVVLTASSQRNKLLESAFADNQLTVTVKSATGGWIEPLVFHDVRFEDADQRFVWTVKKFQTSKGMFSWIYDPDNVGEIRLTESSVTVKLDENGQWPLQSKQRERQSKASKSQLSFDIRDGSLSVIVPWREIPIVELDGLHVTGNIGPDDTGQRILNVDPVHVFDRRPISESQTEQNLALIAPILSQSTTLSGTASVWLDAIRIPLNDGPPGEATENSDAKFAISGHAEFHSLDARLKETWTRQMTMLVGQLSGTPLPDRIRVLEDSRVDFSVDESGIYHNGMHFLVPEIAEELTFTSSGLIRLDETIDLLLTLNMPKVIPAGRPILVMLSQLSAEPIQVKVGGTVSEPRLQLPEGMDLLGALTRRIAPAQYTEEAPPLQSVVLDLMQNVGSKNPEEAKKDLPGNILNLIRAIDKQVREKSPEDKPARKKRADRKAQRN